jgi:hypothetical protein
MKRTLVVLLLACSSRTQEAAPPEPSNTICDDSSIASAGNCVKVGPPFAPLDAPECPRGTYALPGETCHAVGVCTDPKGSLHVDAAAAAGGDGSATSPFQKIGDAIAIAPVDAVIAVRPGKYAETVVVRKPLSIVGACAEKVAIEGALEIRTTAKVSGVAVSGPDLAILVRDGVAELDQIWVHDSARMGISVDGPTKKTASVHVTRSLIESVSLAGVAAFGATATVEKSVIRDIRISGGQGGGGVLAQFFNGTAPTVIVKGSLIEKTHEVGVGIAGGSLEVIDSLIRNVDPMANGTVGNGVLAAYDKTSSTVSKLRVAATTIIHTHEIGIALNRGEGSIEATSIIDVLPRPKEGKYGVGIQAEPTATLNVRDSLITGTNHIGIGYFGATGRVESTIVRQTGATGIAIADADAARSLVHIERTIVRENKIGGVIVAASDLTLIDSIVAGTRANDGRFGDGVVAVANTVGASSIVAKSVWVKDNARAGFAMFGGTLRLSSSSLSCNGFDLDVEDQPDPVTLTDEGGNACGCGKLGACRGTRNALELTPVPLRR